MVNVVKSVKLYITESVWKSGKNLKCKRGGTSSRISGEYEEKRRRGSTTPIWVLGEPLDTTALWMVMDEKKKRCKIPGTPKAKLKKAKY